MADYEPRGDAGDAFTFTGTWKDYAPIALSNLALTIVTLGIYRFWAKARERRYLWSHTCFIDDTLEWTGTGKEMFIGFVIVSLVVLPLIVVLQLLAQGLLFRNERVLAGLMLFAIYAAFLYLGGLAQFRALRYRLTRSWWHGIRGGSDAAGFGYAWSSLWRTVVGVIVLALLVPWTMTNLWNERWNAMSFGPNRFEAGAQWTSLMGRWIILLLSPLLIMVVFAILGVFGAAVLQPFLSSMGPIGAIVAGIAFALGVYFLFALIGLGYYAAYFREAVGSLSLGGLNFEFQARSKDWLLLFLGDVALVIGTLGIGIAFLGYRHWSFFIRHMGATGEVDLSQLVQSKTRAPREAEGFADAFDIGAL